MDRGLEVPAPALFGLLSFRLGAVSLGPQGRSRVGAGGEVCGAPCRRTAEGRVGRASSGTSCRSHGPAFAVAPGLQPLSHARGRGEFRGAYRVAFGTRRASGHPLLASLGRVDVSGGALEAAPVVSGVDKLRRFGATTG